MSGDHSHEHEHDHSGFHDQFHQKLHHILGENVDSGTAQTSGMRRYAAISGDSVGSRNLWMGQTHVDAGVASANHHHGESETAIYIASGTPEFVFLDEDDDGQPFERRFTTKPGDYIYVPPFVPHREENPSPDTEAVVVISRTTQEAIVVNLDSLSDTTRE